MASSVSSGRPSHSEPDEFDLLLPLRSTRSLENPYPIYSVMRTIRPVLEVPAPGADGPGGWLLTRYADVHIVLCDPRFSVERTRSPLVRENLNRLPDFLSQSVQGLRSLLTMDRPDHTRIRKLVNKAFTPKRIGALRARIHEIVSELADAAETAGQLDRIHDFDEPLPAVVIAELLGVPPADHRQFRDWSSQMIAAIGAPDTERRQSATAAAQNLLGYLSETIAERRQEPRDDLISAMIQAQEERDALSEAERLTTSNLLLLAGHETTTNLIGHGTLALLREPDQWRRLCNDPSLLPNAIEELLRFEGPVQATVRVTLEGVEIDGRQIPEGALVIASLGAAHHDAAHFHRPDRLNLTRTPNPHLAFGFGTHFCMGPPWRASKLKFRFAKSVRDSPIHH